MSAPANDDDLGARLQRRLGRRHPVVAVATIAPSGITAATLGASMDADFEIGSISKGITGLLYVDARSRGEVTPDTTLGDVLPLGGCAAAAIPLASLATHSSGLPGLPPAAQPLRRTVRLWRYGTNPYGETVDELLEQTRGVTLRSTRPRYSNLGFELLGHAVARAAELPYAELLRERITGPVGLASMYAPARSGGLMPEALLGTSRAGRAMEPWTGEGIAPAGGIRASIGDMALLARALLDGSAPGVAALDPVANFTGPAVRIGAGWITLTTRGRSITWHNGGTGGFRTWLGLDRDAGTAVVLLSARAISVDHHGFAMLAELA